jgi:hypothetical protein
VAVTRSQYVKACLGENGLKQLTDVVVVFDDNGDPGRLIDPCNSLRLR